MPFIRILQFILVSLIYISYIKCQCSRDKWKNAGIVPEIIDQVPEELQVVYGSHKVECGEELKRSVTEFPPTLNYSAVNYEFYTLVMIDPDAPDPHKPVYAQFLHWLTVNIPGTKISEGKDLMEYMHPSPPSYSDAHRYIFLIYHQPSYIFSPSYMDGKRRSKFNMTHMVSELELDGPEAGNFFYTRSHNYFGFPEYVHSFKQFSNWPLPIQVGNHFAILFFCLQLSEKAMKERIALVNTLCNLEGLNGKRAKKAIRADGERKSFIFLCEDFVLATLLSYIEGKSCQKKLKQHKIVPDFARPSVSTNLKVIYDKNVNCGELVSISRVPDAPTVKFDADGKCSNLAFILFDPDAPTGISFGHWVVVNVPSSALKSGTKGEEGDILLEYFPPGSQTGDHRYTCFVYCQQHAVKRKKYPETERTNFDPRAFSSKNDLNDPVAATYFNLTAADGSSAGL